MRFCILALALLPSTLRAYEPPITATAFSPAGERLVGVSQSGIHVFEWPELKRSKTLQVPIANLHAVSFSPSGQRLLVAGGSPAEFGSLAMLSWPDLDIVATLREHDDTIRAVAWIDDSSFVSASMDRNIKVWDAVEGAAIITLEGHSRGINAACLLQDQKTLVTAGIDQSLRVWDLESGALVRSLNQHTAAVQSLALRPSSDGLPILASAAADRTIRFWQPTIGRMMRYIRLDAKPLSITWLDDAKQIAAACDDGHVRVIDWEQLELVDDSPAIDGWAYSIAVNPKAGGIAVAGSNDSVQRLPSQRVR